MHTMDENHCQPQQTFSVFWDRSAARVCMNPELTPSKTLDPAVMCSDKSHKIQAYTLTTCVYQGRCCTPCLPIPDFSSCSAYTAWTPTLPTIPSHCCKCCCGWLVTVLHLPDTRSASWSQIPGHGASAAFEGHVTAGAIWSNSEARRCWL